MSSYGFVFPVLVGKESLVREVSRRLKQDRAEYEQSRQRGGVTLERAYLQKNPDGASVIIAYLESDRSFAETMGALVTSDLALDRYFIEKNKEATGIDF